METFSSNNNKQINLTGLEGIPGIIYINLDNRPDRYEQIISELSEMGAPSTNIHRVAGVYIPKNGHKGCIQSHIIALRLAIMNKWSSVAIFEDDAQMIDPESFKSRLALGISELPNDWDVLMLGTANKQEMELNDKN